MHAVTRRAGAAAAATAAAAAGRRISPGNLPLPVLPSSSAGRHLLPRQTRRSVSDDAPVQQRQAPSTPSDSKAAATATASPRNRHSSAPSSAERIRNALAAAQVQQQGTGITAAAEAEAESDTEAEAVNSLLQGRLLSAALDEAVPAIRLQFDGLAEAVLVSPLWLRDACTCPRCVTPSSGQKQFVTAALPADPAVARVDVVMVKPPRGVDGVEERALRVVWREDDHESTYPAQALLLALARLDAPTLPALPPRRLWDRALLSEALQPVAYDAWMEDGPGFARALTDLHQLGIAIVDDVPETVWGRPGVRVVAERIGNIQNTFYGETFDVVSKPAAENVAYTSEFLCLHQDLLYMNDPPYIQLLHCLRNDSEGGESLFSDSVAAAIRLQQEPPSVLPRAALTALATLPLRYHYERNGHYYYRHRPVLDLVLDAAAPGTGRTGGIHDARVRNTAWSPPFQQAFRAYPLLLPPSAASANAPPHHRLQAWHTGAARFQQLVEDPHNMFEMRLRPGQCVLFNNRRVLHGRRQFAPATGGRHLQGTYIDEQTFTSRIIGLVRNGLVPPAAWGDGPGGPTTRQRPVPPSFKAVVANEGQQVRALLAKQEAQAELEEA